MTEHTPSPWVVHSNETLKHRIVSPQGDAELGTWVVADARWPGDATLIAAAPDLLEELKKSTDRLRDYLAVQEHRNSRIDTNFDGSIVLIKQQIAANEAAIVLVEKDQKQ